MVKVYLLLFIAAAWLSVVSKAEDSDESITAGQQSKISSENNILLRTGRETAKEKVKKSQKGKKKSGKVKKKSGKGKKKNGKGKKKNGKGKKKSGKGKKKSKKGKKTSGKGKKKNGKGKKKSGKGKKKNGKGKKKSGKGKKKSGKGKKKSGKGKKKAGKSTRVQEDSCVVDLATLAGIFGNQAINVNKQCKRAKTFSNQMTSKSGKKDDFKDVLALVLSAAGGNSSTPKCKGEVPSINDTITETLSTLNNCSISIEDSCASPMGNASSDVSKCADDSDAFRSLFIRLFPKVATAAEICASVTNATLLELRDKVTACIPIALNAEAAEKTSKQNCDSAFQACRKVERNAADSVSRCGGGGLVPAEGQRELETATRLDAALETADMALQAALDAAGLSTGAGADGTLPSGGRWMRQAQEDGTGCTAIKGELEKFNKSADATITDPKSKINEGSANETVDILTGISSRSTLVNDLSSCRSTNSKQVVIVTIIYIRFYIFWCRRWRILVITIRIQIIVVIYNLPGPATSPPALTTNRPNGLWKLKRFLHKF